MERLRNILDINFKKSIQHQSKYFGGIFEFQWGILKGIAFHSGWSLRRIFVYKETSWDRRATRNFQMHLFQFKDANSSKDGKGSVDSFLYLTPSTIKVHSQQGIFERIEIAITSFYGFITERNGNR